MSDTVRYFGLIGGLGGPSEMLEAIKGLKNQVEIATRRRLTVSKDNYGFYISKKDERRVEPFLSNFNLTLEKGP